MKTCFCILFCVLASIFLSAAEPPGAKNWSARIRDGKLDVILSVPADILLYADQTTVKTAPALKMISAPQPTGEGVFDSSGDLVWTFQPDQSGKLPAITVSWQACDTSGQCFMPEEAQLSLSENQIRPPQAVDTPEIKTESIPSYTILASEAGYMPPEDFVQFLQKRETENLLAGKGFFALLLFVLAGGLMLNLTPCVLPLIPINLALIGAGKNTGNSRGDKILRGTIYGAGIAVAYGLLGVIAILTSSTFGAISANWIFNAAVAVIFFVLALAMFDLFSLDFSALNAKLRIPAGLRHLGVFLMGALSATLAGACVAPVLVAVLIETAAQYSRGNTFALLLPFLLGVGMALPWPFAAAGLSLFPKPGAWMVRIKQILAVLILALAVYYGYLAFTLADVSSGAENLPAQKDTSSAIPSSDISPARGEIDAALALAKKENKLVLLDFWASWCKNCTAMDIRTFPDPRVQSALKDTLVVKVQLETTSDPAMAALQKEFKVPGLPFFVLLKPE